MDIVFVHGWGFGPDIWHPLSKELKGHHHFINLEFIRDQRPSDRIPDNPVIIGHSLGFLWALKHIAHPTALISIAGFENFTDHQPVAALRAMQRRLAKAPAGLMADFWQMCDSPLTYDSTKLDTQNLAKGLEWLQNWNAALQKFHCPKLLLAATNDQIISKNLSESAYNDVHWSKAGGHMLPLTKTTWCAEMIEGFLYATDTQRDHCE